VSICSKFFFSGYKIHLPFCDINFSQVSEKRWYWLKVLALVTIRDWEALEKFSKEKRPPMGKISWLFDLGGQQKEVN
jgi:hypothetical protein